MLQSLKNRRNRKGFTLAELLIVVAIIAVLVAIAVPLFVGQVKEAEDATKSANIRAVRGETTVYLLKNSTDEKLWGNVEDGKVRGWIVDATVSANGEITLKKVESNNISKDQLSKNPSGPDYTYTTKGKAEKDGNGGYTINLYIVETDVVVTGS